MTRAVARGACVRSGYCCKVATCAVGVYRGAEPRGCRFLVGDRPGEYACRLVLDGDPLILAGAAIGAGCSSTLFNVDRDAVLRRIAGVGTE